MQFVELDMSVKFALLFSGIFLFVGMLTGVWKYAQIRHSPQFRAHYSQTTLLFIQDSKKT